MASLILLPSNQNNSQKGKRWPRQETEQVSGISRKRFDQQVIIC